MTVARRIAWWAVGIVAAVLVPAAGCVPPGSRAGAGHADREAALWG